MINMMAIIRFTINNAYITKTFYSVLNRQPLNRVNFYQRKLILL